MPRKKDANGKEIRRVPRTVANGAPSRSNVALAAVTPVNRPQQASTGKLPQYYVFTLNNYTDEDIYALSGLIHDEPQIVYYLDFGVEIGESGTPHLQGQLECNEPSMSSILCLARWPSG